MSTLERILTLVDKLTASMMYEYDYLYYEPTLLEIKTLLRELMEIEQ